LTQGDFGSIGGGALTRQARFQIGGLDRFTPRFDTRALSHPAAHQAACCHLEPTLRLAAETTEAEAS
jgi:hypothetical protein